MSIQFLSKQLLAEDHNTPEFHQLVEAMNDKFFTFDNPDEFQLACKALNLFLHRGDEWMIQSLVKVAMMLIDVDNGKTEAATMTALLNKGSISVDVYKNTKAKNAIHEMLKNAVVQKAQQQVPSGHVKEGE